MSTKIRLPGTKQPSNRVHLEATCLIDPVRPLAESLQRRIVGQDEAVQTLICSYARLLAGLRDSSRPLLTALLLGPTGVGKTETARAFAHTLFGWDQAMTRVNCEEYAHGHEISKLLGSPPSYVGSDIEPLLSQRRVDEPHRQAQEAIGSKSKEEGVLADRIFKLEANQLLSIILFDEIEKAHPTVWSALLGILEEGKLTLGSNSTTDFSRSIILMTSNVGSREISELLEHRPIGFHSETDHADPDARSVKEAALTAARKLFPHEFLNRFDDVLVYAPLKAEHLDRIFDKLLLDIHQRALNQAGVPLLIKVSPEAKKLLVERGTDVRFGARPLRRVVERELVDPLSRFIASHQLQSGDIVEVERNGDQLTFFRSPRSSTAVVV